MDDWIKSLVEYANSRELRVLCAASGIGIEFRDGCDVFWILPGEVTSTLPISSGQAPSLEQLISVYEEIDRIRERALHVIRHYLASKKIGVDRRRSGEWGLTLEGGATTTIGVGAHLTSVARDTRDIYQAVKACIEHSFVRKAPSRKRSDRYLGLPGPPADEASLAARGEVSLRPTIRLALAWMGICRAADSADKSSTPQTLQRAAAPLGRIAQALLRLSERLPNAEGHADLSNRGALLLSFADGYADFEIATRSRELARRIRTEGSVAVGDQLADEFLALSAARSQTLGAIWQATAARGWRKQRSRLLFLGGGMEVRLGQNRREIIFRPDEALTNLLKGSTPEAALRQLFANDQAFAQECVAALRNPVPEQQIEPPDADLAPRDLPAAPPLLSPDRGLIDELDRFAGNALREYMAEERTIWEYRNLDVYDPSSDTWAAQADWVDMARRQPTGQHVHPMATVILLDAHDPLGDQLARAYLSRAQPHHEVSDAEVEIVWRYRHEFPQVARQWFSPQPNDQVPFAKARAKLGDPVAIRHLNADKENHPVDENDPASVAMLSADRQDVIHRELLEWARSDYRWSGPRTEKLRLAAAMGWTDVADALPENPWLLAGLLTRERRSGQFDEPGILLAGDFLLTWSRFRPSLFLSRLLATAYKTDLVSLAEEASRQSAIDNPKLQRNLDSTFKIYRGWLKQLHPALAIAWTRCRRGIQM